MAVNRKRNRPVDPSGIPLEEAIGQYDNKKVVEFTPIIELNAVTPISALRDDTQTSGTGTTTNATSEYRLRHAASGDFARIASAARGRYLPGTTSEVGVGMRIPAPFTEGDGEMIWGYFDMQVSGQSNTEDINDAIVFGKDALGNFVEVCKSGVSKHKVYQNGEDGGDSWNISTDPDLDTADGHIYQAVFNYYGFGLIIWRRIISIAGTDRQIVLNLHSWKPEGETSIDNTNLQVGAMIKSSNSNEDVSMYLAGRKYGIYGPFTAQSRVSSKAVFSKSVGTSAFVPIMTFRRKITRRDVSVELFNFSLITNNDIQVRILVGTTLTGETYGDVDAKETDESALEVDVSASSYTGGNEVFATLAQGGGGTNRALTNITELPQGIPDEATITFAAKALSSTATVQFIGKIREEW